MFPAQAAIPRSSSLLSVYDLVLLLSLYLVADEQGATVLVHKQAILCPELPELSVFGFDDLLYGGYLYTAPRGLPRRD